MRQIIHKCNNGIVTWEKIRMLLYWPLFGLLFLLEERFRGSVVYHEMYCGLDDLIPFEEIFLIRYLFWFVFIAGMLLYTFVADAPAFCRMMRFVIVTYSAALVIFWVYPTVQYLRPAVFSRDNLLVDAVRWFYNLDTNTNVCPSLHVVGSLAVLFTAWNAKGLQKPWIRAAFGVTAFLICVSTVFLKQHSVLDLLCGLILCAAAYPLCFRAPERRHVPTGQLG